MLLTKLLICDIVDLSIR